MRLLKSKTFWAVIVLAGIAAGTTKVVLKRRAARPPVQWETTAVDRGRIVARVTATGILSALVTVQVGSQVSGSIQKLYADFNSPVKKGQIIAKIDPRLFQASLENARANYAQAKATLMKDEVQARFAERQSKRQGTLVKDKLIAPADFDTAESAAGTSKAQVEADKANVQQARAILHQAEVNLALTNITSPTDGVVISRNVDVGQTVAASLSAPIIFVIAEDLRKMQVDTSVAEADVGKLSAGMDATFVVDAYPGERFKGKVRQIRNAAQTLQNVVTYDAVIDVNNSELKLRPGMTANVNFVFANRDSVLRVPNAALRFRPSPEVLSALKLDPKRARTGDDAAGGKSPMGWGAKAPGGTGARQHSGMGGGGAGTDETPDRKVVWVLGGAAPRSTRIKIGTTDGTRTEVVEGELAEGDQVITDATLTDAAKSSTPALPGAPAGGPGRRPF
jgi:HlyD family secretion protein